MTRRYPLETLAQAINVAPNDWTELARRTHQKPGTLAKQHQRQLSATQADRLAIRTGYHPSQIWPTWIHDHPETGPDYAALACTCWGPRCECGMYPDDGPEPTCPTPYATITPWPATTSLTPNARPSQTPSTKAPHTPKSSKTPAEAKAQSAA